MLLVAHFKMRTRTSHSISIKYFQHLCSITEKKLEVALSSHAIMATELHWTRDIPLCNMMLRLELGVFEVIVDYLKKEVKDIAPDFSFHSLCHTFKQLSDFQQSGDNKDMKECPHMYTPEAAMEFHYLLLGTITGFSQALEFFKVCPSKPEDSPNLHIMYNMSWKLTHLLWQISHSLIL